MATPRVCIIEGCDKGGKLVKGWCDNHYRRWRRHGDPEAGRVSHGEPRRWLLAHTTHRDPECLTWPYGISEIGYAKIAQDERWRNASRVMCEIVHGPPPSDKHQAAHLCGNGHEACVNPQHLYWALPVENVADTVMHGTRAQGERQGNAKLTEADVIAIRQMAIGARQSVVAEHFGISKQQVSRIVRRDRWAWLPMEALG